MRILVVGAGATGGYFGARLARAGRDVTFLVRERRAAQLRERGLRVRALDGDETIAPQLVTAAGIDGPYDVVLLSVKATGLDRAIEDVAPAVGPDTMIVPFLNGMAHLDALNARFGKDAVLGGVVVVATTVTDEGDIQQLAPGGSITVGEQAGGSSARVTKLGELLSGAGFELTVSEDIVGAMWQKWVFIASIGALTCLARGVIGEIVAVPGGVALARDLLAEVCAVAAAAGFPEPDAAHDWVESLLTTPDSPMASSLYRDLTTGQPTEVEHLLGDLVTRAKGFGVPTPLLALATLTLRIQQNRVLAAK